MTTKLSSHDLWQESLYQVVMEVEIAKEEQFVQWINTKKINSTKIGKTQAGNLKLNEEITWNLSDCKKQYHQGLRGFNESRSE